MAYTLLQLQQMGATPVTSPTPTQGGSYTATQLQQMGATPQGTISQPVDSSMNTGDVANSIGKGVVNFGKDVVNSTVANAKEAAGNLAKDVSTNSYPGSQAISGISDLASLLLSPVTGTIGATVKNVSDLAAESPTIQNIATSPTGDALANAQKSLTDWSTAHPVASKALMDTVNDVMLAAGGGEAKGDIAKTGSDINAVKTAVTDTVGNVKSSIGNAVGGVVDTAAEIAKPITDTAQAVKTFVNPSSEDIIANRVKGYEDLTKYASVRNAVESAKAKGFDPFTDLASDDRFNPEVNKDGKISTENAIENLKTFIEPVAKIERAAIEKEGARVSFDKFSSQVRKSISSLAERGSSFDTIQNKIEADLKVYKENFVDANGTIDLAKLDDIKNAKYSISNWNNEDAQIADKAVARTARQTIIDTTKSADVKALNEKMSQYYSARDVLEAIDGKTVKGGRLGKYFARTIGSMAGSHFGPIGTVVGAGVGDTIEGAIMKGKFGGKVGVGEDTPAIVGQTKANIEKAPLQLTGQSNDTQIPNIATDQTGGNNNINANATKTQNLGESVIKKSIPRSKK